LPGSRIAIVSESLLYDDKPDYVVVLPWNLKAEVMSQRFRLARTRFGLDRKLGPLDLSQFAVPAKAGDQLSLF